MKLVCPSCGITASAELWAEDAATREALATAIRLPKTVQDELLRYLGLFRPEKRALSWARTRTLITELLEQVEAGVITFDGKPTRACPPAIWAEAMREMTTKKSGQKAHFANHNYLRAIAYQLADKADAANEKARERRLQGIRKRDGDDEGDGERTPMPAETRESLKKLGIKL